MRRAAWLRLLAEQAAERSLKRNVASVPAWREEVVIHEPQVVPSGPVIRGHMHEARVDPVELVYYIIH